MLAILHLLGCADEPDFVELPQSDDPNLFLYVGDADREGHWVNHKLTVYALRDGQLMLLYSHKNEPRDVPLKYRIFPGEYSFYVHDEVNHQKCIYNYVYKEGKINLWVKAMRQYGRIDGPIISLELGSGPMGFL